MRKLTGITSYLNRLVHRCHGIIAIALLATMFSLGFYAMVGNTAVVDEVAHIPAGYSYLHFGDYRLNPEHPPLIKDLAGLPLQFMHLNFPSGPKSAWTTEANAEWDTGWQFLYASGNNAGAILFWARLPILILAVAFGGWFYCWARRRFGIGAALLGLFFYTLSPNIIANSNLVTTDLGAAIFIFVGLVTFVRYVERPGRTNLVLLAVALAVAQLTKFSSVLLYPFLLIVSLFVALSWAHPSTRKERLKLYTGGLVVASIISLIIVWIAYIPETINMPAAVQQRLIAYSLPVSFGRVVGQMLSSLSPIPIFKPLVQYLLGVIMVFDRVAGGNTTFFIGKVTNESFRGYFPVIFTLKTQLSFLILGLAAIVAAVIRLIKRKPLALWHRAVSYSQRHFTETVLALFVLFYFSAAVLGNLDLGLRHILPIYLPLFVLMALAIVRFSWRLVHKQSRIWFHTLIFIMLGWYAGATLWIAPSFLAYFNELIGGPANGNIYFSDSSIDWGQDLGRLKIYLQQHHIQKFALDYFGGAVPSYYFPDGSDPQMISWHAQSAPYSGQYIAVSETYLDNDLYYSAIGNYPGYGYLRDRQPIAKIGYSIYLYKLY
jgi:hypothetical protein